MWCSHPISSPVSSKTAVPPAATRVSNTRPTTGFAVIPLVPSEPPQIVPTTRSDSSIGTERAAGRGGADPVDPGLSPATVARVPPRSWITSVVTGRPDASTIPASRSRSNPSQPSDTSATAPTFGWVHSSSSIRWAYAARIAAAEADDVHVVAARGDRLRDGAGALDEVDDHDDVADADPAVGARVAQDRGRGGSRSTLTTAMGEGLQVVAGEVVGVHPGARLDVDGRRADRHPASHDAIAGRDGTAATL